MLISIYIRKTVGVPPILMVQDQTRNVVMFHNPFDKPNISWNLRLICGVVFQHGRLLGQRLQPFNSAYCGDKLFFFTMTVAN